MKNISLSTLLSTLYFLFLSGFFVLVHAQEHEDLKKLEKTVYQHLKQKSDHKLLKPVIEVNPLSATLTLPKCQKPIKVNDRNPEKFAGRLVTGIECESPFWRTFISAKVDGKVQIVASTKAIYRNSVIQTNMVKLISVPYSSRLQNHLTQIESAIGMRAKRSIRSNTPIDIHDLLPPFWVYKNKPVTLLTMINGVSVETMGIALKDAFQGQTVLVRNATSDKLIRGIVIAPNKVQVP
jgi:flagella basal body P-ring formation protein FlgA